MKSVKVSRKKEIQWNMKERLEDLDYADDICLLAQIFCDMEEKLKRLKHEGELVWLHININKTKGLRVDTSNMQKFRLEETEIEEVLSFVYLGNVVSESGETEEDVASRIKKANGVFVQQYPV
jgi:glycerol-3-phosphate responsive antiterminator